LLEVTLLRAIEARSAMPLDAVLKQLNQLRGQGGAPVAANPVAANVTSQPMAAAPRPAPAAKIEQPPTHVGSHAPVAVPQRAVPEAGTPAAAAPAAGNLRELWTNLLEAVGRVSQFTRGYLIDAHPVSFEKNVLVIGFDPEFEDHLGLVDNSRNHTILATKLSEMGHPNSMIKFIKAEAPAGWVRTAAAVAPPPTPAAPVAKPAPAPVKSTEAAPAPVAEKKTVSVPFSKEDFKNDPLIQKALEVFKGTIVEVRV
jgi:hypothetical protein